MKNKLNIQKTVVGYLSTNCYLLKIGNEGLIVDPGDEIDKIIDMIGDTKILGILITHAHFDHIGALDELVKKIDVPIYYYNINKELNYKNLINLEEKEYEINNFKFRVIYTKGHRNDSVTFYFYEDEIMFTGDFLFYLSIGRTDLKYGDFNDMIKSIKLIKKYDDNIIIYPGHSSSTTLVFEKQYNEYLLHYN